MVEPTKLHVTLSFDAPNPIRVHTDLSMFAQSPVKKSPDRTKIQILRKLSSEYTIDRNSLEDFIEDDQDSANL